MGYTEHTEPKEHETVLSLSSVLKHRGDVRYRIVGDEAVILRRVLELVDARSTVEQLIDTMAEEYDVERKQLERDVLAFLKELLQSGIVEETG